MNDYKKPTFQICPKCGKGYREPPTLSREDNETYICPTCGAREALEALGLPENEQNEILEIIRRNTA